MSEMVGQIQVDIKEKPTSHVLTPKINPTKKTKRKKEPHPILICFLNTKEG